jgi:hypothetical protein
VVKLGASGLRTGAPAWFSGEFHSFAVPEIFRFNGLRGGRCGVRIPIVTNGFFFLQNVQTGPRAHPASYSMSTGSFRLGKVARTWSWPLYFVLRLRMSWAVPRCPPTCRPRNGIISPNDSAFAAHTNLALTYRRLLLKCDGTRAETRFRLSAKRTSPFKSAGASVQSTTGSRGVRISGINAGYTMLRASVKSTGYPLHSPVSLLLPLPTSPCAITFLDSTRLWSLAVCTVLHCPQIYQHSDRLQVDQAGILGWGRKFPSYPQS